MRTGAQWRDLPTNFPPWEVVSQQMQRWITAGCFAAMTHDLRVPLRGTAGRTDQPTGVILDSRTVQRTPESGDRATYDGDKRRKGSKMHLAVDTLGHLLELVVTPAKTNDRAVVGELTAEVQAATNAGSWSAASRGPHGFGGWRGIMNGCRTRWRGCISSPSPA